MGSSSNLPHQRVVVVNGRDPCQGTGGRSGGGSRGVGASKEVGEGGEGGEGGEEGAPSRGRSQRLVGRAVQLNRRRTKWSATLHMGNSGEGCLPSRWKWSPMGEEKPDLSCMRIV